ncbi:MAG: NAD-dependent epimerase/dehydratase family protein [Thermodesulfobacteria bacterium]|nr:NAD-dependent epimerase/dehydratase family protein [Thermodesulfobacteriota bacterium]
MKAFVTGGTGFVGSSLVRLLLEDGYDVGVLVREKSNLTNLEGLPVTLHYGDLKDKDSLKKALKGYDFLFHVAADYRLWVPKPDEIYENNVKGTKNIMDAAGHTGIKRIVYTSSVATLGLNEDGSPADEETPVSFSDMIGHYKKSKFLAEKAVKELVDAGKIDAVIVNPSTPVGPRDIRPTPTGRMILEAAQGKMPAYVDTGLNIVHVDDVSRGHILALKKGKTGRRYILGGENMTLKEIFETISEITGTPPPRIKLPHNLILPLAYLFEMVSRITGTEPLATVDGVKLSKKKMFFSSRRAEKELGYSHRPARQAIRDAVEWFKKQGLLQK